MPDTKQLTILKRLTALLESITPANGYSIDLTGRVFRGRSVFGPETEVPFVSILESLRPDPQPVEGGTNRWRRVEEWELLIQGWTAVDMVNPTDALYELKGAIEKCLARIIQTTNEGSPAFPNDYRLGRTVAAARIGPGIIRAATPQAGGTEALYLPLILDYSTDMSDPWSLS